VRAEIVGVGTEILLGQICNDNAKWMSERLAEIGVDVLHHQAVGDKEERIAEAFRLALSRSDVVLITGGLGPTQDDITREGLAAALGVPLVRRPEIEDFLRERFASMGREMPEANLQQADVPEGGRYILPKRGSAPGLALETPDGKRVYAVAGVPSEMREMMNGTILPELAQVAGPAALVSRILRVTGLAEAHVAELLDDLFRGSSNPSLAYLAGGGEVKLRLTAKAPTPAEAEDLIAPVAEEIERRLGSHVFTTDNEELEQVIGRLLKASQRTVAAAESLTGGGLALRLTRAPGASAYFKGSAVTYTPETKRALLGVSEETIREHGVVSEECAREMAQGARRVFDADLAVALTGVAGPEPHDGKPAGTVCVALAAEDALESRCFRGPGDRDMVRRWAEQAGLDMLRRYLEGESEVPSTASES
jgi:competence/damage-inducible protein CinA-like protein